MIGGWVIVAGILATLGLPILAVGIIVRLCEGSWGKKTGELGSTGFLIGGGLLSLPLGMYLTVALCT